MYNCALPATFEEAAGRIIMKLVNHKKTDKTGLLNMRFLDFAVTFAYYPDEERAKAPYSVEDPGIMIFEEDAKEWGVSVETVYNDAREHCYTLLPPVIEPLSAALGIDHMDISEEDFIVVTNEKGVFGAACLLYPGLLSKIRDRIGDPLIILPSSVHEIIVVRGNSENMTKANLEYLHNTVMEINRTEVEESIRLSDNVYFSDGSEVVIACRSSCDINIAVE